MKNKILSCLAVTAIMSCLLLSGCDTKHERGEIISINMATDTSFIILSKNEDNELVNFSFYYYKGHPGSRIYCDVKEGESMWYEGDRIDGFNSFQSIDVHVKPEQIGVLNRKNKE